MKDHVPLDLRKHCNARRSDVGLRPGVLVGRQSFYGLDFQIGGSKTGAEDPIVVAVGGRFPSEVRIPVGRKFRHLVFAHMAPRSDFDCGDPMGCDVGEYTFRFAGGSEIREDLRERWQIGGAPFLAKYDQEPRIWTDEQNDRYRGLWDNAGVRLVEVRGATTQGYHLWPWRNPRPDERIESVTLRCHSRPFFVAAITGSTLGETPFQHGPRQPVWIQLPKASDADKPFDLRVEVDRGTATYPQSLPRASARDFLTDPFKGWGEEFNDRNSPAYVEIAASPSATIRILGGETLLGSFRWEKLLARKQLKVSPRLDVALRSRPLHWVRTRILDAATRKPVPCRIHFRTPEGIPYAPHGHHTHVNRNLNTWNYNVGGDVRLGQITYAYTDGECEGWLPRGEIIVDVARGFEYEPLRRRVTIRPGQRTLDLVMRRWTDMRKRGWHSGEGHVHFMSTRACHFEGRAEDLSVVDLMQAQLGHQYESIEEFTGKPDVSDDGRSIVYVSSENRQYRLGHINLLGIRRNIPPWSSDGPGEAELGGTLEDTMCHWADACHAQGGLVVLPHFPYPNGEPAIVLATGRADAIEMLQHSTYNHAEYYRYLNYGLRVPLTGGTDKMSNQVPCGTYRTYACLGRKPLTYRNWCDAIKGGNTFVSGGPMIEFSVNGRPSGAMIALSSGGGVVTLRAKAESIFPIHTLQILRNGKVIASKDSTRGARRFEISMRLRVEEDSWFAARCGGPGYTDFTKHHDVWRREVMAHASPAYVSCGNPYAKFDEEVARAIESYAEVGLKYVRETAQHPKDTVHHHGKGDHLAYLERPFREALRAVASRRALWRTKHRAG